MKSTLPSKIKGFTLIELLVVIAIIAIMLTMAASMMKGVGSGKGLTSGIETMDSLIQEARSIAMGKGTWARFVVVTDMNDNSSNSMHLRYMTVMELKPEFEDGKNKRRNNVDEWLPTARGIYLPSGIYFSPQYSTLLQGDTGSTADRSSTLSRKGVPISKMIESMRLTGKTKKDVYYIEFDPLGRLSFPSRPTRLVLMGGVANVRAKSADEGIIPKPVDDHKRPTVSGGVVVWPKGTTSRLRTIDQIVPL